MRNVIALRNGEAQLIEQDPWQLLREPGEALPDGLLILPLASWLACRGQRLPGRDGLWLGPDDEVEPLRPWLAQVPLIAVDFPSFRDGRGYSQAYLLRTRLGWHGELRAIGDVLRDQLSHMRQCGFDSYAVREDKCATDALQGLAGMSVLYGRSVIEPRPLFRRR
ncbi:DUF934 domain-containing protein [Pseudomonas rubra]|uniref:DUF934 domain-containing protein n=1 Tax=Pseudomonas rubra TaxID=2942627 RepID=A0ABT5P396_9PSED|nr:DUF934 domain-containing protein [Pseudomonas rubra]MDD1012748.1 DUF934 domain-containing protein [Pseudomonas rubra]MDD1036668.1 DUF934 domain-containing protein [Pseudomonas rubra]MDD1156030.1 DUF934 domain-containing protein [Pseudomonas rubra]